MRVGNFSLMIPEGREKDSGHVELAHGTVYRIKLINHFYDRRCDATVTVDGKEIGCFRMDIGNSTVILERGVNDDGKFTFFKDDSEEAQAAGVSSVCVNSKGLIQVVFQPERPRVQYVNRNYRGGACGQSMKSENFGLCSFSMEKTSAGITGLTGHSNQNFYHVPNLVYDPGQEVTISLRLVCGMEVRPLLEVKKSNPIPEPVSI